MNDRQIRTLRSFESVVSSMRAGAAGIAPEAPAIIERLAGTAREITRLRAGQTLEGLSRHGCSSRVHVEAMRQTQMLPLARLGRRIFAGDTAITSALRVPHKRASNEVLLAAAELMVKTLRPHHDLFSHSAGDARRVGQLHAEVRRVRKLVKSADGAVADRAVPTRRIAELFVSARLDVQALDALIGATRDKKRIRDWKELSRVGGHIGRPKRARRRTADRASAA